MMLSRMLCRPGLSVVMAMVMTASVALVPGCASYNETRVNHDIVVKEEYRTLDRGKSKYGVGYKVEGKDLVAWAYKDLTCRKEKIALVNRQVEINRVETSRGFIFGSSSSSKIGWGAVLMGLGGLFMAMAFIETEEDAAKTEEEKAQYRNISLYSGAGVAGLGLPFLIWGIVDKARAGVSTEDLGTIEVSKGVRTTKCGREYAANTRVTLYLADGNVMPGNTDDQGRVTFDLMTTRTSSRPWTIAWAS